MFSWIQTWVPIAAITALAGAADAVLGGQNGLLAKAGGARRLHPLA